MNQKIICKSLQQLPEIAQSLLQAHIDKRVFAFKGNMGAGKTTFIKEICAVLGVENMVNSPTFSIINEYFTKDGKSVFHFDFYRIKKKEEILDIGYEEYLYSGNYCFMEWPEKIEELLPENIVYVSIEENPDNGFRIIQF
jgi:tRNA threonylcarbamoyladenosine biosynthesis protein TsaE